MNQAEWNRLQEWSRNQGTPDPLLSRMIENHLNREAHKMGLTRKQFDDVLSGEKG